MSQLRQALTNSVASLTEARVGSPRMNAEVLLMFTLGVTRAYLYAHPERELTADEQARVEAVIAERASGVPAQYITGHQEFWGLDFLVTPAVLIPRPETEHVIETVLELARGLRAPRIVDVGAGSGCIALALARELRFADIIGVDNSPAALEIARINAARLQLDTRVRFEERDLLSGFAPESFDLVVSNPPYVGVHEEVELQVRRFEPHAAIFGGETGMDIINRLVLQAHEALKSGGWLVFEMSAATAEASARLLAGWSESCQVPDLQGIPRVAVARK
jgi:release factor glutamine methyltransferase